MPRIIVIQQEARRRYAVARSFHQMGFLSQLVTGPHAQSRLGKLTKVLSNVFTLPPAARRLNERQIEGIPQTLVRSFDAWFWKERHLQTLRDTDTAKWLKARDAAWFSLTENIRLDQADLLYTMGGQNLSLLKKAQKLGVKIVVDAFISPISFRQTFNAKREIGIKPNISEVNHRDVEAHYKAIFEISDVILCPSHWVAEGVLALDNRYEPKIRICPYGSSLKFAKSERVPIPGRIFWAGGDWFRKGLHHLAAAADILKPKYPNLDFRIAGITDSSVISMLRFKNLNFLGKLDRSAMECEFKSADMFVFPTLTEGMAGVVVEAIASGCPVITTRGAGIDAIEHGKSGLIVEVADHETLAKEIETLFLDRQYLATMSQECFKLAINYTEDAQRTNLENLIEDVFKCSTL